MNIEKEDGEVRCLRKQSDDKERVWGGEWRGETIAEVAGEGDVPWLLWKQHHGGEQGWEIRGEGRGKQTQQLK